MVIISTDSFSPEEVALLRSILLTKEFNLLGFLLAIKIKPIPNTIAKASMATLQELVAPYIPRIMANRVALFF